MSYITQNMIEDLIAISYSVASMCPEYVQWDKDKPDSRCCSMHATSFRLQEIAKMLQTEIDEIETAAAGPEIVYYD